MLWMLVSVSLSVNTIYMDESTCELAAKKMRDQHHDAICFPVDPDADMVRIESTFKKFFEVVKGFKDETRR